ncbi:hypothetical protein [Psychroserpens sp.]|uniref:hypothetical protein n=1 Tax=Psychroserpens sp. TaxID=2020870 RepID=UPI002B26A2B9|nr:hypothetical protein [Psychroserpens sp.]
MKRDLFVMVLIMALPFLFYLYTISPKNTKIWKTQFYTFNSGYFETIDLYFWTLSIKFLTIGLLSIWFISCLRKWKYVLVIPICFEFYKLFVNINYAENGSQDINLIKVLFISALFLALLIVSSIKLQYVTQGNKINNLINEEINNQLIKISNFDSNDYKLIKKELLVLKRQKGIIERKEYLIKLIELRDRLTV